MTTIEYSNTNGYQWVQESTRERAHIVQEWMLEADFSVVSVNDTMTLMTSQDQEETLVIVVETTA
jgi:hypothetical protein